MKQRDAHPAGIIDREGNFTRLLRLKAGRWLENRKNRTASRPELQSLNRKNRNNHLFFQTETLP